MMLARALLSLSILALFACASDTTQAPVGAEGAAEVLDLGEGGAADLSGFPVVEVGEPGRHVVDIAPLGSGAEVAAENLAGVAHAFRLRVAEPTSVAFVARVTSGSVDPHAVLKTIDGETLGVGRDQAFLPMAAEVDSLITIEADAGTDYVFVVADTDLGAAGQVTVDVVFFSEALGRDLSWTDAGVRAIAEELREREPQLSEFLASGALLEGVDGYVSVGDLSEVPLRERASVNGFISQVDDLRGLLYERYGEEERSDAVGRAAAELYWAVRAP